MQKKSEISNTTKEFPIKKILQPKSWSFLIKN